MALTIFKLEKLTIEAHDTKDRTSVKPEKFEAQFNPTELSWRHKVRWSRAQTANASGQEQTYEYTRAPQLDVTLTLDGTNVDAMGLFAPRASSVQARIEQFKKTAYAYKGTIHEPPYLRVSWGAQEPFDCRLCSFDVKYTLFDRDGAPLRAELTAKFIGDLATDKMANQQQKSSPDLTHARIVKSGDTLPLLTRDVYGSSEAYVDVARYNGLDDFRKLVPGRELLFPPLDVFARPSGGGSERGR